MTAPACCHFQFHMFSTPAYAQSSLAEYLEARLRALEKCHAMVGFIESTVLELDRYSSYTESERAAFNDIRLHIRAAQGRTWSDMAMWAPLSDRASRLVKEKLKMYTETHVNYSMEHLLPYAMRNSLTPRDELRKELENLLNQQPKETTNEVVEVTVPKRAIDKEL